MRRKLELPWTILLRHSDLFTSEELNYIAARNQGRSLAETQKLLNVAQRTLYHHQRTIYFKWLEYLFKIALEELGLEQLPVVVATLRPDDIRRVVRDLIEVK